MESNEKRRGEENDVSKRIIGWIFSIQVLNAGAHESTNEQLIKKEKSSFSLWI